MQQDILYIINWWLTIFFVGLINVPLTWLIFKKFIDRGYGFSKTLGVLFSSFIVFLLSIFHLFPFSTFIIYFSLFLLLCFNIYVISTHRERFFRDLLKSWRVIIFQEILFMGGLILWSLVRGYQPGINGLEKFMDFGFINSLLRSEYLPPTDMWFAGESINYYWYGHFVTAFLTKLSQIPSGITYNLMLATILGLGLTSAFSISSSLVQSLRLNLNKKVVLMAGIISAILLIFAGNFHTPYFALKNGKDTYWYPDATRFIGYNPDTNDKTIHEFPMYSFVVSDLHAHLINFPFVLLYIALLFRTLSKKKRLIADYVLTGFVLGVMFMTNAWDFANYSLVTGIATLLFALKRRGLKLISFFESGVSTISIVFIGLVTTVPFLLNFDSIAQGVSTVNAHSSVWQLAILWGFPAVLTIIFGYGIYRIWPKMKRADIFVLALLVSSLFLIILPEVIYVKDIYIGSHHRANTMFKLTYQAFVMSYLSSGYIVVRSLSIIKRVYFKLLLGGFFAIVFASILWYPSFAIKSYYGNLKEYKGLSGETWFSDSYPELYSLTLWIRENINGQPVILEAPGDSYTGLPTVSGWFVHEWLWRGTADIPQARVSEITEIYTSEDSNYTQSLLNKYRVEYVIIGDFEREKFPNLYEQKFNQLGKVVYSSGNTRLYRLN